MRIAILITFLISVVLFENCGSSGSGNGFNIGTSTANSTGTALLTASPIQLTQTAVPAGVSISPTSVISGSDLVNITCTWNIINSASQSVVTPVAGIYNSAGSFCSGQLVTPTTSGQYGVTVTVTDGAGDSSRNLLPITVGQAVVPTPTPSPKPTPTPSPTPKQSPTPIHDPCPKC
jgi:hypothetical protein